MTEPIVIPPRATPEAAFPRRARHRRVFDQEQYAEVTQAAPWLPVSAPEHEVGDRARFAWPPPLKATTPLPVREAVTDPLANTDPVAVAAPPAITDPVAVAAPTGVGASATGAPVALETSRAQTVITPRPGIEPAPFEPVAFAPLTTAVVPPAAAETSEPSIYEPRPPAPLTTAVVPPAAPETATLEPAIFESIPPAPLTAAVVPPAAAVAAVTSEPVTFEPVTTTTPAVAEADEPQAETRSGGLSLLRETAIIVVSALIVSYLIKSFLAQAFYIPSESMRDTLQVGDRVMVSRLVPRALSVHHGDIVVFKDPGGWLPPYAAPDRGPIGNVVTTALTWVGLLPQDTGEHLIKRAVGLPGDHVTCCDVNGRVQVNGISITETYIRPGTLPSQDPFDVTVPADRLFVLGDNRQDSADSRYNANHPYDGFVPIDHVVGTAFAVVWPLNQAGWLRNPGAVFEFVPLPTP